MPANLDEFQDWLKTVSPYDLWRWLCDAYWQGELKGTELERAFLLLKKGVDLRTKPV